MAVQDLRSNQEFDIRASGSLNGNPAPLPDAVVFLPSGPISLVPLDQEAVIVKATGVGTYSVVVSCGTLAPVTVEGTISDAVADTLVVTLSEARNQ